MNEDHHHDDEFSEEEMRSLYVIKDLDGFCRSTRKLIADDLQGDYPKILSDEELDQFITIKQVENLVRENQVITENHDDNIYMNMIAYEKLCDIMINHMYGSALSKLAADGYLETAWDDNLNDMVFWASDKTKKYFDEN